ncbi:MAG: hypothetical protein GYB35_16665, partial [Algicola sp.]|nr:hypothetical protein [Algicola sp.]
MKGFKLKDYLISILIVSVTLLYFGDKYLNLKSVKAITIFGFEIGSFGFLDIAAVIYFSKMKLLILFFSITWYLTCKNWWRPAILVIITLELFKLTSIFNSNAHQIDEIEYLSSLPIILPVIGLLILLSFKLNKYRLSNEFRSDLDAEIDEVFFNLNQDKLKKLMLLKEKIDLAKKDSKTINKKDYMEKLIT